MGVASGDAATFEPRDADEHGNADGVFVHDHLVEDVVVAELVAVFAGEDDDGVFGEAEFVEFVEDLLDGSVEEGYESGVSGLDLSEVSFFFAGFGDQLRRVVLWRRLERPRSSPVL